MINIIKSVVIVVLMILYIKLAQLFMSFDHWFAMLVFAFITLTLTAGVVEYFHRQKQESSN